MPRKHLIASQTNKKQQSQAKLWQKLAREIRAAAKVGGTNIDANPRLKAAVQKALANNLSRESIERNIKGVNNDQENIETLEYEAYGPDGLQIIIHALTSNSNRTAGNIRGYLSKLGGKITKPNSVKVFFENKGLIIVPKTNNITVDSLLELTMDYDIYDILEHDDGYEIYTSPECFYEVVNILKQNQINIYSSDLKLFANEPIEKLDDKVIEKLENFIEACDNDDDIQWVVTNYQ